MNDEEALGLGPVSGEPMQRQRTGLYARMASLGASAQAAIPGLYAWAVTVMPAAWSRGAPVLAKTAAIVGVIALVTAPLVEGAASPAGAKREEPAGASWRPRAWTGPTWARAWSVWGFVLSSAMVWALAPAALSSARFDGVRGALGMVGWALFAFASAGPALRSDPVASARIVRNTSLKPRSEVPRGDGLYIGAGVVIALGLQAIGWGVSTPERAVLVRLVTVVCGIAILGGTTSIALARHGTRQEASRKVRVRRALPWLVLLVVVGIAGAVLAGFR